MQGSFLRAAETAGQIEEMLNRLNRFLLDRTEGEKYATLFYCTLESDGLLRWTNAAHCAPILVRATGELETLDSTGMPVGMLTIATYEVKTTQLHRGDKIVVYSDGVTEAQNLAGEFFEFRRLSDVLRRHAQAECRELHDRLMEELRAFTGDALQSDDITLVVVEYRPE
jgi:sigma-B regulation protein RsbU (phosphoserine phosphatase)